MKTFVLAINLFTLGIYANAQTTTWTLSTDDTVMTVSTDGHAPVIQQLGAAQGEREEWVNYPAQVPLLEKVWIEKKECPLSWKFQEAQQDEKAGTLTLFFTSDNPKLALSSVWKALPGRGPIEHWITIQNLSAGPVTLAHQDSLTLTGILTGNEASIWWIKRGGSNASTQGGTITEKITGKTAIELRSNCDDGASPCPWLAIQNAQGGGMHVGWEFSGLGRISATAAKDGKSLEVTVGNLPDFRTDIEPGETFYVPPAFVGCYIGGIDDGAYALHRWIMEKVRPAVPDGLPDPILAYNLYLDAGGPSATEAAVLRSAEFCHDIGFEAFMPDAMWFPACGDWRWDPARFPNGVAPIEQYVHNHDMKLALWCAWTNGGIAEDPGALSVRGPVAHLDWFESDPSADWTPGPFYGARICLACPEAKEWAMAKTKWLVEHHNLDYLKHDCGPIITQCNKTTHRHHYGVDASYWAVMGYYEIQEKLRTEHPGLLLENCSGGGHIKDFGIIRRTHYTVTTDTLSNLPDRQSIYDSTFAFPPILLQAYTYERNYKVPGDDPGPYLWRSAMMSAWQIDPTNTRIWTEEDRACALRHADIYKTWIRPMFKDVKVHHILPRPDGKQWDALFYWSPSLNRGTVYIFRPASGEAEKTIPLQGLDAGKDYWIWGEDGAVAPGCHSGKELMNDGIAINLPEKYSSELVYVRDSALGKPENIDPPGAFSLDEVTAQQGPFAISASFAWSASANARSYRLVASETPAFDRPIVSKTVSINSAIVDKLPPAKKTLLESRSDGIRRQALE